MQIHELPDVTAIGSGGYFATDNGSQTTKIDYDALAKAIIEQYSASTLAGSAQSVKAALDGLDGNKLDLKAGTAITNGTNVNTLQTPGTYFCASASTAASLSNIPTQATSVGWRLDVARNGYNTDNYLTQTITGVSSGVSFEYVRGMSTKGTWGGWLKAPTRAEVDALNSNLAGLKIIPKTLTAGGSVTFTSTTVAHYVVFVCGAGGQRCAVVVRSASATGYTILSDANGASNITVSASGRNLTIASADTASAEAGVYAVVFSGTVS